MNMPMQQCPVIKTLFTSAGIRTRICFNSLHDSLSIETITKIIEILYKLANIYVSLCMIIMYMVHKMRFLGVIFIDEEAKDE